MGSTTRSSNSTNTNASQIPSGISVVVVVASAPAESHACSTLHSPTMSRTTTSNEVPGARSWASLGKAGAIPNSPPYLRNYGTVVKGVGKRTTPTNVFSLLFAAQHAMKKLDAAIDAWADVPREVVHMAQKAIDECLAKENETCFEQAEWVEMLEGDRVGFEDGERVGWVMEALKRGMSERYAPTVYQVRLSSLLR